MKNSFSSRGALAVGDRSYEIYRLSAVDGHDVGRLPYALKILLENLLRCEDGKHVTAEDIAALAAWNPAAAEGREISFRPARVLLQDFTGIPVLVDLAAMRTAIKAFGGDPGKINPVLPVELVVDHSVQVDRYGRADALDLNVRLEYQRNKERYGFLKWGQKAFTNFRVVPPATGIVHQVNLEHLAQVVFARCDNGRCQAYPDTLVGTDSHTTMINSLGILGWGVGGIEAEAAMLGLPISMLIPPVAGVKLSGELPEGATATDLVLTIVQMLREHDMVGKFVEFFGEGLAHLSLADRATIANMAPEYGATCGIFPIDEETLNYLRLSGREADHIRLVEAYAKEQGLFHEAGMKAADYSEILELDLATVEPSLAGPYRPQDRVPLRSAGSMFSRALATLKEERGIRGQPVSTVINDETVELTDGSVVIAAITSCANTSNPTVMLGAGLLAKKAREKGLKVKPWVKTSMAPGSKVVTLYLEQSGLLGELEALGFNVVGYGCTTCIGNSGPLPEPVTEAIVRGGLSVCSVLSGNRNFEGRIHPRVRMNYLASPPLVVAYALAGHMALDLYREPLGNDPQGRPVFLKDIWPGTAEIQEAFGNINAEQFRQVYHSVFMGEERWASLESPEGKLFQWREDSTYIRQPPYFLQMAAQPPAITDIENARVLVMLGDSITTDHISPAGAIPADSVAGSYLMAQGVAAGELNSYGSRRGNHQVMMRGTFANTRLRNRLIPGSEGGVTLHLPDAGELPIYDAAMKYRQDKAPLIIIAGKNYGSGSSRDWAAKGPQLLGVRAVIAESFEHIHRSNLVGMGLLPLQFMPGENVESLGLDGRALFTIRGMENENPGVVTVRVTGEDGGEKAFRTQVRIDTPHEWSYYRHGGILPYVLRQMID